MLIDIDQLITIAGMVIRTSNIMPEMREAFFKCIVCAYVTSVEIERGRIAEPTLCTNCNTNHCFSLIHNRSQFTDKQMVKLQESPGECIEGTRNAHVALVVTLPGRFVLIHILLQYLEFFQYSFNCSESALYCLLLSAAFKVPLGKRLEFKRFVHCSILGCNII